MDVNLIYVALVVLMLVFMFWALRRGEQVRRGRSPG